MSELPEGDYTTITETLMLRICDRKTDAGTVELENVKKSYNGWQDKDVVEKAIIKYQNEKHFYEFSPETYSFPVAQARYVKVTINLSTPNTPNSLAQISEIVVFGNA